MDIRTYILGTRIARHTARITSLTDLNAPDIVLDQERALLAKAQAGDLGKVSANTSKGESATALLAREFTEVKWQDGRGGKPYATFATPEGPVTYFPAAKFGPFITTKE